MAFVVLLLTLLIACVPVIELKGAIPIGIALSAHFGLDVNVWVLFAAAYLGSCLPAPIILTCLMPMLKFLGKTKLFGGVARFFERRFEKKQSKIEEQAQNKYGAAEGVQLQAEGEVVEVAEKPDTKPVDLKRERRISFFKYSSLFLFVAVPLPLTGCWTGSAIGAFLKLKFKYALPLIMLGNLVAGLIVMLISLSGFHFAGISINL